MSAERETVLMVFSSIDTWFYMNAEKHCFTSGHSCTRRQSVVRGGDRSIREAAAQIEPESITRHRLYQAHNKNVNRA